MQVERFAASPVGHLERIRGTDGRTGREYDHFAFIPDPLDDEPALSVQTWRAVSRAGHALGRLLQAGRQVPQPGLLRRPTLRREAQSTSALEGTFAPLEDVLAADAADEIPLSVELAEVLNYVQTAEYGFAEVADGRPLGVAMVEDMQGRLARGTHADTEQAGHIRTIQVAIGETTSSSLESARYVPPPPGEELQRSLRDLLDWTNNSRTERRDPVVSAAMAHYQFEALHPFNDGNGRIGRLLVVLQLIQDGALEDPLLSISPWFEQRRRNYQDRLFEVSASGDWDGWVRFFAEGIEFSALDTAVRVDRLLRVQEAYAHRLRDVGASGLIRDLAESLIAYPYIDVSRTATRLNSTFQTVNKAVARLVRLGILRERTGRSYGRLFEAPGVLEVLTAREVLRTGDITR
ncbi:Fic/DOC family N-terminal domain-containing protein [Geodermatophilus sp. DSM 44513]|uniref:Fic family protein n=1 Tax=Geodermatophilus sp. DSM 44513 TaxID=1528104 RepID=UPI00126FD049|nr:Fic/DOC family N-terminal domain-containing protein [Geodermatophilus sp. DSM 44513]WNV76351.1 Fic family protein [Geodermatophilus sp. DSM 44513]